MESDHCETLTEGMIADPCVGPHHPVEVVHQAHMGGVGVHLPGGEDHLGEKIISKLLENPTSLGFNLTVFIFSSFQPQEVQEVTQPPQKEEPQSEIQVDFAFPPSPHFKMYNTCNILQI